MWVSPAVAGDQYFGLSLWKKSLVAVMVPRKSSTREGTLVEFWIGCVVVTSPLLAIVHCAQGASSHS